MIKIINLLTLENNAIKCTIEELKKKISEGMYKNEQYFLLNAVVTDFNIDFDSSKFYSIKWYLLIIFNIRINQLNMVYFQQQKVQCVNR